MRCPQDEALGSFSETVEWITARCDLARDDRRFLGQQLLSMSMAKMIEATERYIATWMAAAQAEPAPHRKANAGRFAANRDLRSRAVGV